jgi:hypothetical protein
VREHPAAEARERPGSREQDATSVPSDEEPAQAAEEATGCSDQYDRRHRDVVVRDVDRGRDQSRLAEAVDADPAERREQEQGDVVDRRSVDSDVREDREVDVPGPLDPVSQKSRVMLCVAQGGSVRGEVPGRARGDEEKVMIQGQPILCRRAARHAASSPDHGRGPLGSRLWNLWGEAERRVTISDKHMRICDHPVRPAADMRKP